MDAAIGESVNPTVIQAELTKESLIREFRGIEIHCISAESAPSVMIEIGRIREVEFRREGGGTGQPLDIDSFDRGDNAFYQLVAWDPKYGEIIGMYRLAHLARLASDDGTICSPTGRLFDLTDRFVSDFAPYTVELGRSVVNRRAKRAVMGLFSVWAGLGAVVREYPDIRYFFGKITTFPQRGPASLATIHGFLDTACPDPEHLLGPFPKYAVQIPPGSGDCFGGLDRREAFELLRSIVTERGDVLPPLLISYFELSETMRSFGTVRNPYLGGVCETAILVTINDIDRKRQERFIDSYTPTNPAGLQI